eukprot:14203167-Ditylum_brightwellii.AAC.1
MHRMVYDLEDLGTHIICKGATTYAISGTTASSGGISIGIRGMDYGYGARYMHAVQKSWGSIYWKTFDWSSSYVPSVFCQSSSVHLLEV